MNRWMLLLVAALPFAALAEETIVTRGDALIVEEIEGETRPTPARRADRALPARGLALANVRNVFGEPHREYPAVGDPPITRWDYAGYSVFFEHDKVLHTVVTE